MGLIRIHNRGKLGNRMFQYLFCRMLQIRVPGSQVVGYDMPMWGLSEPYPEPLPGETLSFSGGHRFDVASMEMFLNGDASRCIDFGGYAQRIEYLGDPRAMAAMFPATPKCSIEISESDLFVNIRGAEILRGDLHGGYMPIPISFYERLVEDTGLRPVFVGQIGVDPYSIELRRRFQGAVFVTHVSPLDDYAILSRAVHVVLSISTFAWLATWMSENAQTIHMPVLGIYNPASRPDIDLLPRQDERYKFYDFPVRTWRGRPDDMDWALS